MCPSKRPAILQKIRKERKQYFNEDTPEWAKENLGCTLIATFGKEKSKSAVLTACRGYRSEDYPNGIEIEIAQYMSSLIPQERGFLWSISDVVYGNENKGRKPVASFIKEINNYPGLLDIILSIENCVNKRSSHASGVIMFEGDPFEHCAFMKTPNGEIITQFDLGDCEYLGLVKYDFLVTEACDKIVLTLDMLKKDGLIEKDLSLKETYDKYLHPSVLPIEEQKYWDSLNTGNIINCFQFDSLEGVKALKKIKPQSILELTDANGLLRLMGEGEERPIDKYVRQKNDLSLWYKEMAEAGLTQEEQTTLEPYFKQSYGVPPSQESLMLMLMDKDICGFSLAESNSARKIVGKKKMAEIPALHKKIIESAKSEALGKYVWKYGAGPQMGYAFPLIHALAYSFIGFQTVYLATRFNPIYWDTACLIVNSGATDPDNSGSTNYAKLAKAIGDIIAENVKISLADINKSMYGFVPNAEENTILFGLKSILNVGDDVINRIIENRPYTSVKDFYYKVKPDKREMIALIKAGAFDQLQDRYEVMIWYLWETSKKKKDLNLRNLNQLISFGLLPEETEEQVIARRIFEFNRYLKAKCKSKNKDYYILDNRAMNFMTEMNYNNLIENNNMLNVGSWDKKVYQKWMDIFRKLIKENKEELLEKINYETFLINWNKYIGKVNLSAWEMETLCFYYHEHEMANLNLKGFGVSDFFELPENPVIEKSFKKGNKTINMFKLSKICGTCIAKDKTKSTVYLLTTTGVVTVKFRKEYFALFDKQISEKNLDGTKSVKEKSWFNRGSMIMVTGMRSGDEFIVKKYASTGGHQLYKMTLVDDNNFVLATERYKGILEDE